jgi:YD repeat-containing protein
MNAHDKLIWQREGKCQITDLRYDALGRLIERRETQRDFDDPTQISKRQVCGTGANLKRRTKIL